MNYLGFSAFQRVNNLIIPSTSLLPRLRWEVGTPVKLVSTWGSVKWVNTWYVLAYQAKMGSRYTSEVGDSVKWGDTMLPG